MRLALIAILAFMMTQASQAQSVKELEIGKNAFAFHQGVKGRIMSFSSDDEARAVVASLMRSIGLPVRFEIRAASVPNAAAVLTAEGKRLILYNVIFMEEIKKKTKNYWSLVSIMAHEIGHHLAFHMSSQIGSHKGELEADRFSGFMLGKLGATLDDALAAMRGIATEAASDSHPGRQDRLQAIALGWKDSKSRSPVFPQTTQHQSKKSDRLTKKSETDHPELPPLPPNTILALAAAPGELVLDEVPGGSTTSPFVTALLPKLGTKAKDLKFVLETVVGDVAKLTKNVQVPWIDTNFRRRIPFDLSGSDCAIVVASGSYHELPPLKNPRSDGIAIAQRLKASGLTGTTSLINGNSTDLKKLLSAPCKNVADRVDTFIFYFSGHGYSFEGSNFLAPTNLKIRRRSVIQDGLDIKDLFEVVKRLNAKTNVLVIDTHFPDVRPYMTAGKTR